MNWTDLSDILTYKYMEYLFVIRKPEFRGDIIHWWYQDGNNCVVEEGTTARIGTAKSECKRILKHLRDTRKGVFVRKSNKLKVVL